MHASDLTLSCQEGEPRPVDETDEYKKREVHFFSDENGVLRTTCMQRRGERIITKKN